MICFNIENFFHELYRVLKRGGKLTIVTDNRLYAHSLAKTVDHINSLQWVWEDTGTSDDIVDHPRNILAKKVSSAKNQSESESDSDHSVDGAEEMQLESRPVIVKSSGHLPSPILVRSGDPEERGDHLDTDEGSSYFSRMWKNGNKSRIWNLVLVKR